MNSVTDEQMTARLSELTRQRNAEFARLSRSEKACAVATDAIAQVTLGTFLPKSCIYFNSEESAAGAVCVGCALGGLLAGLIDGKLADTARAIRYEAECGPMGSTLRALLADVFDGRDLEVIEDAFEGFGDFVDSTEWFDGHDALSDRERFLRIAANIVHNRGKFNPNADPTEAEHAAIINTYSLAQSR